MFEINNGIGRIFFIVIFLGFPVIISLLAAVLIPLLPEPSEQLLSLIAIFIIISYAVVMFIASMLRMKNIGYSKWWSILILVPGINTFFLIYCFVVPEGYAYKKSS